MLTIRGLSKTFVGTKALDSVDFDLRSGEIHALVGQNGCGKSTLIKVLAGYHAADPGAEIKWQDRALDLHDAAASRAAGFRFVHQDLGLIETLDAVENLILGRAVATAHGRRIRWDAERRDVERRMRMLGYDFDVRRPVGELGAAERTGIAIARALWDWQEAKVLVVDEPTASLPREEVRILFDALRRVRDAGLGVVYVSHRLDEIFAIADRVTVLRDGGRIGTWQVADIDQDRLVSLMIGAEQLRPAHDRPFAGDEDVVLETRGLCGTKVDGIDFTVRRGEVLGIAGLTGSGREEILPLLFGAVSRHGEVFVDGQRVPADPRGAVRAGLALVPADRRGDGAVLAFTLHENYALTDLGRFATWYGRVKRTDERGEFERWIAELDIKPPRPDAVFGTLSGGNQQKVVLAKWMRRQPKVLLLDEPSQGVDVAAKATIHALARDIAGTGAAVLIASSDDAELCDTCDRVLILRNGRIAAELRGDRLTAEEVGVLQLETPAQESTLPR
jgi:ribose transport system ATP-binding protein